ncbi:MAG: STT3 domain-containing protein [Thermoplasmatota archaeon]
MRKRSQRRMIEEQKPSVERKKSNFQKKIKISKNQWMAISLIGIFFMVLLLNSYFNMVSEASLNPDGDRLSERFYLSGPDPYYNMRLVEQTLETGRYPFYHRGELDPLLNYPLGRLGGGRAPLLNMAAIGFSRLLMPFMDEIDAVGYAMQFVPALFGALLVFPVYFIGKTVFGRKEGLIAAMICAIIPVHLGGGHGSAFGLFDHDSLNILLYFLTFLFLIKAITEKDSIKSLLYSVMAGVPLAGLSLVWTEARFLYVVIAGYAIVQALVDIFTNKTDRNILRNLTVVLITGYLISMPTRLAFYGGLATDVEFFVVFGFAVFALFVLLLKKMNLPWLVSMPIVFTIAGFSALVLYFIEPLREMFPFLSPLSRLSSVIFGEGVYGNKVSGTIAEASTFGISRTIMSYGPVIYWLAWFGFIFILYQFIVKNKRRDYLFLLVMFVIFFWLTTTAGRFINEMVPIIALFAGFTTWYSISKINFKMMFKNIKNAGGGLRGLRKGIKIYHIVGILFVIMIILPNAFLAFDAAIPFGETKNGTRTMKIDFFGEDHSSAFGSSYYKEYYWIDAFSWLHDQNSHIDEPSQRPAFMAWWDYGFKGVAVSDHPVVADNFQSGIPPASNFHTATSEHEAVGVFIIRILEGNIAHNNGQMSDDAKEVLTQFLGEEHSNRVVFWMENPEQSPSYHAPIGAEYDEELSRTLVVGEQYAANAYYHDITSLLNDLLDDERITVLYRELQDVTGFSIRYYGIEGYDENIFNIFGYLSDKSLVLNALRTGGTDRFYNPEDDFTKIKYKGYTINPDGTPGPDGVWTAEELNAMSRDQLRYTAITDITSEFKPDYYNTMFYRTYIGNIPAELQNQVPQLPCWGMKHFTAEYISPYPYFGTGRSAVVIAQYWEGAKLDGRVDVMGEPFDAEVVVRKGTSLYGDALLIDHDKMIAENGSFNVIAPGGNITLEVRRYPELGINAFVMQTITFNSTTNPNLAPITDDDAMRKEGSNFQRTINISIDPASLYGYVFEDIDGSGNYNSSIDIGLSDVKIALYEIDETDPQTGQPSVYGDFFELETDENGYYNITNLRPGIYLIQASLDEFIIYEDYAFLFSGQNSINISKPKPANISGTVYFDINENGEYDAGEEMGNVDVEILYATFDETTISVDSLKTDETGRYAFSSLTPGQYVIKATKTNTATGHLDYEIEEPVMINENETKILDVPIWYANIEVSGKTLHQSELIGDIQIQFSPDLSIENNTAQQVRVSSDEDGFYVAKLQPGKYNVSVNIIHPESSASYLYTGQLSLLKGQGFETYDINLEKETASILGKTTYNNQNIVNISISFLPDDEVPNNTARFATTQSDQTGNFKVELVPGTYVVAINQEVKENGVDVIYTFSGSLIVKDSDVSISYDIALAREVE